MVVLSRARKASLVDCGNVVREACAGVGLPGCPRSSPLSSDVANALLFMIGRGEQGGKGGGKVGGEFGVLLERRGTCVLKPGMMGAPRLYQAVYSR